MATRTQIITLMPFVAYTHTHTHITHLTLKEQNIPFVKEVKYVEHSSESTHF